MPDGIDPGVQAMEPTSSQPAVDRVLSQPHIHQLPARHHSMLASRQIRNPDVRNASPLCTAYIAGKCNLGGHATRLHDAAARLARGLRQLCGASVRDRRRGAADPAASRPGGALDDGFGRRRLGFAGGGAFEGVGQRPQVGAGRGLDDVGGDADAGRQAPARPQHHGHLA